MAHILVNGISAKSGGGKSILTNFLSVLKSRGSEHRFTVIVPEKAGYASFAAPNVQLLPMPVLSRTSLVPFATRMILPRLIREQGHDLVLNLADIPIPTTVRQMFLFDWSYAAYPESVAWQRASHIDGFKRKMKLRLFRKRLSSIDLLVAQGDAIRRRLQRLYDINDIEVIPNAVSIDNLAAAEDFDFDLPDGFKLLCLSHYYSHKNLEIFVPLAERIRDHSLDLKIIMTIDADQGRGARKLLADIERRGLGDIIINVGSVPMLRVPSLYRQCDALLLPTLLESFSGTYAEAMHHGKPIFTSGYEFATDICKDAAIYFDPLNADDIFEKIRAARADSGLLALKIGEGRRILAGMMDWGQVFESYIALIEKMLEEKR